MTAHADTADALARLKDPSRALLLTVALMATLVNYPMLLQLGSISAQAFFTIFIAGATLALWLARPWLPMRQAAWIVVPLVFYIAYAACTLAWFTPSVKGIQLLMVLLAFLGIILVTAREVDRQPGFAWSLMKALDAAPMIASAAYLITVVFKGMGNEDLLSARGYAIFALLGVARMLARWRQGETKAFWYAAFITTAIVLSVSRTAMVVAVAMFPIAAMSKFDRRGMMNAILMAVIGGVSLAAIILLSPTMKERFFGFDTSMSVGGVAINASGRQQMWDQVWKSAETSIYFGKGIGSSALLIDQYFPSLAHPHNDYLRLLHDEGIIGLSCYAAFLVIALLVLGAAAIRLGRRNSVRTQFYVAAVLSILGVAATHATDNTISYSFVMMPFGLILGCALGLRKGTDTAQPAPRRREAVAPLNGPFGRRRFPRASRPAIAMGPAMNRQKGVA